MGRAGRHHGNGDGHSDIVVIVLALRAPTELVACVDSLLSQDVVPEILVVNSGGGDAGALLASRGLDIPVLEFPHVLFAGAARNAGIAATSAPVVAFLASDCVAEPGWVAGRLARHRAGHAAVASAVVNSHPRNIFAWAAHLSTYALRLPGLPEDRAIRYGASYDRSLFAKLGLFREDFRTGEDTEFHRRLSRRDRPVWAPEIRTVHRNPASALALMSDQFRRGMRGANAYQVLFSVAPLQLAGRRYRAVLHSHRIARQSLSGADRFLAFAAWPIVLIAATAYAMGVIRFHTRHKGKANPDPSATPVRSLPLKDVVNAARQAQKARDWLLALECWEVALALAPQDVRALKGRARALLRMGSIDQAEAAFRLLATLHPDSPEGLGGLLDVMWSRPDHAAVVDVAGQLWRIHRTPGAASRLVASMVHLGHLAQADAFIEDIVATGQDPHLAATLRSDFYRASFQWSKLADQLSTNRSRAITVDGAFASEVDCLLILGRIDALRELLEGSPPVAPAQMDATMVLAIARVFGRSRVRQALLPLLRPPDLWLLPGSVLHCAVAAAEERDYPVLMSALHQLGDVASPHCRDRTLPLLAPFAAVFHAWLAAARGNEAWPPGCAWRGDAVDAQFLLAIERTGTGSSADLRLRGYVERIRALRGQGRPLYLHVSSDFDEALAVADAIVEAVEAKAPLSVVRLGDGEASFLPCHPELVAHRSGDQAHFFDAWWGRSVGADEADFLERSLTEAIGRADIVGIPDLEQLGRHVKGLSDARLMLPGARMMRGYARVLEHMFDTTVARNRQILTSSHFHQSFVTWRLWEQILRFAGSCSLITCHRTLSGRLASQYGIQVRQTRLVPPEAKWADAFTQTRMGRHFPDFFEHLRDHLDVQPGEVWLVGAGVLGKIYCHWIKRAGGIAIDVGSLADHWCGYRTRYTVDALQSITPISMDDYERLAGCDPRIARFHGVAMTSRRGARQRVPQ